MLKFFIGTTSGIVGTCCAATLIPVELIPLVAGATLLILILLAADLFAGAVRGLADIMHRFASQR